MTSMKFVNLVSAFSLISCIPAFATHQGVKTLDIGVVYPISDRFHDTIMSCTSGIELAKALYEAQHPKVRVVFHRYDHREDLDSLIPAIQHAISDKTPAIIGGAISEQSMVINELLRGKDIAWITPTSSHPNAIRGSPFGFRLVPSDQWSAKALSQFVVKKLKPARIGILQNISSPYTDYISGEFLKGLNGFPRLAIVEKILKDTMNFDTQIKKFKEKGVTHLVMFTHQSDFNRFLPQAEALGFFPTYVGGDGWNSNQFIVNNTIPKLAHPEKFIAYRTSYGNEYAPSEFGERFTKAFVKANGKNPTAWSGIGFDAAWLLISAMDKAKNPHSGAEIASALERLRNFKTVTESDFRFEADHGPVNKSYVYQISKAGASLEEVLR